MGLRFASAVMIAISALLILPFTVTMADGTETLGHPSIAISGGSGIAAAGTGLGTQPAQIDIDVPPGSTVNQVLLYWEGQSTYDSEPGDRGYGDDTLVVGGKDVKGTLIGGPAFWVYWEDVYYQTTTFRADITSLDLISAGPNSVEITGFDWPDPGQTEVIADGASLIVIFDDGSMVSEIDIRDGNDFAFEYRDGDQGTTAPQTFVFTPADHDRVAELVLVAADGTDPIDRMRTSTIQITAGGRVTEFYDLLASSDGPQLDTISLSVDIPANSDSLTVQVLSDEGDPNDGIHDPESFVWIVSAMSVPPPYLPDIDIEKATNGEDADNPTGPEIAVGDTATFTYAVTNTGNVALQDVVVTDNNGTPGDTSDDFTPAFAGGDTNDDGMLDLDETWTYEASHTVTAGQYTNVAEVCGASSIGQEVCDDDASNHYGGDYGEEPVPQGVPQDGEGCTPGYWKQKHHFDSWVTYSPTDSYTDIFGVDPSFGDKTLAQVLRQGGGNEKALGRHAVAALLNTSNDGVSYAYDSTDVINLVQQAYATNSFEDIKNLLAAENEQGCPLN